MVRFLVGTKVVCCSVVAVCRRRVPVVARSGVVAVRYSTDALATGGVLRGACLDVELCNHR